jgi:hypothetical protein
MGMDQTVTFGAGKTPAFAAARDLLQQHCFPIQVRMIDGQLAFPDEIPPDDWHELRLGTPQGMVTVRRDADRLTLVTWGNADQPLLQAWNALTWAFAAAGNGEIVRGEQALIAEDFRRSVDLPAGLKKATI